MGSVLRRLLAVLASCCLAVAIAVALARSDRADTLLLIGVGNGSSSAGSCSQSIQWFNRAGVMDATHHNAYDTMICGLATDGVWAKLDVMYVFATQNSSLANQNLVSSSFAATVNGSPTFTADTGYTGVDASTTVYINTGFNPTTATSPNYTLNSNMIEAWILSNSQATASGGEPIGLEDTSGNNLSELLIWFSDGNDYCYPIVTSANAIVDATDHTSTGDWVCTRTASNAGAFYRNGSSVGTSTAASTATVNNSIFVLALDHNGSPEFGSGRQQAVSAIGGGFSATDDSNWKSRVCTYLTTVHGSC